MILGGLLLAGVTFGHSPAADLESGRKILKQCQTCHGKDGYAKIPIAPHIAGEPQEYLVEQLLAFKNGSRRHEMMTLVVASLTEQQIADVSAWYAAHKVVATLPKGSTVSDAPEQCISCHGANGLSVQAGVPNLAGESNIYIETQLKAYKRGKRTHEVMSELVKPLSNKDIRTLAKWYASIKLEVLPLE